MNLLNLFISSFGFSWGSLISLTRRWNIFKKAKAVQEKHQKMLTKKHDNENIVFFVHLYESEDKRKRFTRHHSSGSSCRETLKSMLCSSSMLRFHFRAVGCGQYKWQLGSNIFAISIGSRHSKLKRKYVNYNA